MPTKDPSQLSEFPHLSLSERMRVIRDLHDIEQSLAILGVQMMRAGKAVSGSPGTLHPGVAELSEKLKEIGQRAGKLSRELHNSRLQSFDLAEAVRKCCQEASEKFRTAVGCHCHDIPGDLDNLLALSLLRVIQEALENAGKHSGAKRIQVELQGTPKEMRLMVADDGIGFDVEEAKLAAGLGLISIRERLHLAGGELTISSKRGEGTRISASVPVRQESSLTAV